MKKGSRRRKGIKIMSEQDKFFDLDDDLPEEGEITGYECAGCGNVQSTSFDCNRCGGFCMDPIFE